MLVYATLGISLLICSSIFLLWFFGTDFYDNLYKLIGYNIYIPAIIGVFINVFATWIAYSTQFNSTKDGFQQVAALIFVADFLVLLGLSLIMIVLGIHKGNKYFLKKRGKL